jgi:hypothetical protein
MSGYQKPQIDNESKTLHSENSCNITIMNYKL